MLAVAINGFKKSGKTSLLALIAESLEQKGQSVSIIKYCHHPIDKPYTDTFWLMRPGRTVIGAAPEETTIFRPYSMSLAQMAAVIQSDILLIEGGKCLNLLPRIICLKDGSDEEFFALAGPDGEEEGRGLTLATVGAAVKNPLVPHYEETTHETVEKLVAIVLANGFLLPGLNCKACGQADCAALARQIVLGNATAASCKTMHPSITVRAGGTTIPLNPFTANMLAGGIRGMSSALKGLEKGQKITIEFEL